MALNKRFEDRHVVITGGGRGIGLETALQFAREGAVVSLMEFSPALLEEAMAILSKTGAKIFPFVVDISDRAAVATTVAEIERVQPIDILINNAGIAFETPFLSIEEKEWRRILDVNLTGMFFVSQSVCRNMVERKRGVVVNMSSKNGMDGELGYAHYNSSKAGVIMLTKTMAIELAPYNIRVNAVCPGYIQTPLSLEIDSPEFTRKFIDRYIPMDRSGKASEIAPLFLFLASDESSFVTGQVLVADGGQLAGQKPSY